MMSDAPEGARPARRLEYLPIALFGAVMGLTGLGVVWRLMHARYGAPAWISDLLLAAAIVAFVTVAAGYAVKLVTAPDAFVAEWRHPIAINTFATFWVSMLLLPIELADKNLLAARVLWAIGAVGNVSFGVYVVGRWLRAQHEIAHATPAWLLPVVGLLDMPLAVPQLAIPHAGDVMVAGLACGLFFITPVFTIVFARLVVSPPLPRALEPSLLILAAPFALADSCYVATTGHVDPFARGAFAVTVFVLLVLIGRLRHLKECCPFRVAWWAVSFPLAACTIAALRFAEATPGLVSDAIALALVALVTVVIAWLLVRTLLGIARGELRTLST